MAEGRQAGRRKDSQSVLLHLKKRLAVFSTRTAKKTRQLQEGPLEPQDGRVEPQEGPFGPQEGPSGLGLYCTAVQCRLEGGQRANPEKST